MYNANTLKSSLLSLNGWRQNIDPNGEQLTSLTTSVSGLYFNDEHPLLTFENLKSAAPQFETIYDTWTSTTTYSENDIVYLASNKLFYISLQDTNLDQDPTTEAAYWSLYSPLTVWLQDKTESGLIRGIDNWISKKFDRKTARNLLERSELFSVTGSINDTITNTGKIVGLEVVPVRSLGVKMTIHEIGVQFTTNQTVTVYLFDATKSAVMDSQAIVYTGSGGVQWQTVDWEVDGRGAYYIVYDQDAISGTAINGVNDYNLSGNGMIEPFFGKYFRSSAFEVSGTVASLWNIENNAYTLTQNYGLNLRLNVQCDYTDLIVEQKNLFKTIYAKQVAIDLLNEIINNPNSRVSRDMKIDKSIVKYDIDGDERNGNKGLRGELMEAIDAVTFDTTGIDRICLPCKKKGFRVKAI